MADAIQCDNCGAILSAEDLFCGECGAPRATLAEAAVPAAAEPVTLPEPVAALEALPDAASLPTPALLPPASPTTTSSTREGWRVAATLLVGLGVLGCLGGLLGFLLMGIIGGEDTTALEDWLIGALCCLLPVGGFGAILAAIGATIWYTRRGIS